MTMTYDEAVNTILAEVHECLLDIIDGWEAAAEDAKCECDRIIYLDRVECLLEAARIVYGNNNVGTVNNIMEVQND